MQSMTANKPITREIVRIAATTLILAEGSTTVLGVQLMLRERGFEVYKSRDSICKALDEIADAEKWDVINGVMIKSYAFPTLRLHLG